MPAAIRYRQLDATALEAGESPPGVDLVGQSTAGVAAVRARAVRSRVTIVAPGTVAADDSPLPTGPLVRQIEVVA